MHSSIALKLFLRMSVSREEMRKPEKQMWPTCVIKGLQASYNCKATHAFYSLSNKCEASVSSNTEHTKISMQFYCRCLMEAERGFI